MPKSDLFTNYKFMHATIQWYFKNAVFYLCNKGNQLRTR